MFPSAIQKEMAIFLENRMNEPRKKRTLGEMLDAGEQPFVDKQKFQQNRLAISDHSERVLRNLPLPAAPGRPRKDQEVNDTEAITVRIPLQTIELAVRQAALMGVSRNRWFNIAARRQIQDPISEAELKPAATSNIVMHQIRDVPMGGTAKASQQGYQTIPPESQTPIRTTVSPAFSELAFAVGPQ